MPKSVNGRQATEIRSGTGFSFSSNDGQPAATQNRAFRVILNSPTDSFDIQQTCGISIGDVHPLNSNLRCVNYDSKFEGDSRLVCICTFYYEAKSSIHDPKEDPKQYSPDIRPSNWSVSSSLMEVPARFWWPINVPGIGGNNAVPAANRVGDMYDGVTTLTPIITISVDQFEEYDPGSRLLHTGEINSAVISFGKINCGVHTLMLRGIQSRPAVEQWGDKLYRGWKTTYEFSYRPEKWYLRIPQTGFNIACFLDNADVEKAGMPLKHEAGKIKDWPDGISLPDNVEEGQKARAMVLVHEYENGGAAQLPSAQPVPMNDDGSPRSSKADPKVLVYDYRVHEEYDFNRFNLRLF